MWIDEESLVRVDSNIVVLLFFDSNICLFKILLTCSISFCRRLTSFCSLNMTLIITWNSIFVPMKLELD